MGAHRLPIDNGTIAELYESGLSCKTIGVSLGASQGFVMGRLIKMGMARRPQSGINVGVCRVEGCGRSPRCRRLCTKHYSRWKHNGNPLLTQNERHGESRDETRGRLGTLTYRSWEAMILRCTNPSTNSYHHYGGRGITVHPEWRASYLAFRRDVGRRPSRRHSLDRINGNGHYEPGNCRWATKKQQNRNQRPRGET